MTSKKLWRARAPIVSSSSPPGSCTVCEVGGHVEEGAWQSACDESRQSETPANDAQLEGAVLHTICEESMLAEASTPGADIKDAALQSIGEETEDGEEFVLIAQVGDAGLMCAICDELLEREGWGCAHTGHWHEAFQDCGVRCLQVGTSIGNQHWGCCYEVGRNSLRCPRSKHEAMSVNALATGIDAVEFYSEYHGHRPMHLSHLVRQLRNQGTEEIVWLAGDSTLDNKYWLYPPGQLDLLPGATTYSAAAINGYEHVLVPPRMVMDVAYQVNKAILAKLETGLHGNRQIAAVNTSYECGTLADRVGDTLLPQDAFIRNHISPRDTLVVSVGGNDVALKPSLKTAISALTMSRLASRERIEAGRAVGQGHFYNLFHTETKQYVEKLVARTKPRRVVICTLYFLDETQTGSWADQTLGYLGYNNDPTRLQAAIRHVFETATSTIRIPGVEVVPLPLFHVLDGKTTSDYEERVEPSVTGGQKMAHLLVDAIIP